MVLAAEHRPTSAAAWPPSSWMLHSRCFLYRRYGIKPGACACLSGQSEEPSCKQWCAALRLAEASSALFHQHKPLHCQLQCLCLPLEAGIVFQIHSNQHFMVSVQFGHKQGETCSCLAFSTKAKIKLFILLTFLSALKKMFKTVPLMMNWLVCTQRPCVSIRIFGARCKLAAHVIMLYKSCGDHWLCSMQICLPF